MSHKQAVKIARRFQRAVRIDDDFGSRDALAGYVPIPSAVEALLRMGTQISSSAQRAYTWTGPYGGGKSSLALVLASLLDLEPSIRRNAKQVVDDVVARRIQTAFRLSRGWLVVPLVGRNVDIVGALDAALSIALNRRFGRRLPKSVATPAQQDPKRLIERVAACSDLMSDDADGILIIVDEMGKFLEHAATVSGDIYFFQELAEKLGRLSTKVVLVGVLHQAFEQYASRLGQEVKEEWAKIQGRFVDIPLTTGPEEVVGLLAEAIVSGAAPRAHIRASSIIAKAVLERRAGTSSNLAKLLERCWPLHPTIPLLLAALSRRKFGQNERSTFGFLCSSEPSGFQDFLKHDASAESCYGPGELWNYLKQNLEPAIMASADAHRWAQAVEALERAQAKGRQLHTDIVKAIALLDMFGSTLGLMASNEVLKVVLSSVDASKIDIVLDDLRRWSIAVFRKHTNAWSLFAGSDFELDEELTAARSRVQIDFDAVQATLTHQIVLAKKHYYERGTLRWFDVRISDLSTASRYLEQFRPSSGACGLFLLAIPRETDRVQDAEQVCQRLSEQASEWPVFVGVSSNAWAVRAIAFDLAALEHVRVTAAALEGDPVARREVAGRIANLRQHLDELLSEMLVSAAWFRSGKPRPLSSLADMSRASSESADEVFRFAPILRNELINRSKPSSNAVAAGNELMRRMVELGDRIDLGFEGFPPERAIYVSLLKISGIHRKDAKSHDVARFAGPGTGEVARSFAAFWERGEQYLLETTDGRKRLAELYEVWAAPPFGVRHGVIPILALALLLASESQIAIYLDGQFVPRLDSFFVDRMLQSPSAVEVRRFAVGGLHRLTLSRLATVLSDNVEPDALSIAKPLVGFVKGLHGWVRRTRTLESRTLAARDAISNASDPLKLLFEDLPCACGILNKRERIDGAAAANNFAASLRRVMDELRAAYPTLLDRIGAQVEQQLGGTLRTEEGRFRLSERAGKVIGLSGDFRLDAFATRLKAASDSVEWLEGVGGLAANKPVRDWIDTDIERATFEIADLAARFKRVEAVANSLNRGLGTETIAVVVGSGDETRALMRTVEISEGDRDLARKVSSELRDSMRNLGLSSHHTLAVVAEIVREILSDRKQEPSRQADEGFHIEGVKRWPH